MQKTFFIIDGMAHIYRAYFAVRELSNSNGLPTNAIFGFVSILKKIQADYSPDYFVVAMDSKSPSFRQEIFSAYKANRAQMPEDLQVQIPYIFKVCEALGISTIQVPGFEADDIIATLADQIPNASNEKLQIVIVSNDKDLSQLVNDQVSVLRVEKNGKMALCDIEGVKKWMGVFPEQVVDILSLWGDSSDNIPGAPGIGEKGAVQLITQFGNLETVLDRYEEVSRKGYRESLRDNREQILRAKQLVTVCKTVPGNFKIESFLSRSPDYSAACNIFSELEFSSLLNQFTELSKSNVNNFPTFEVERNYIHLINVDEANKFLESIYAKDKVSFYINEQDRKISFSFGPGHSVGLNEKILEENDNLKISLQKILENGLVQKQVYDLKNILYLLNCPPHRISKDEDKKCFKLFDSPIFIERVTDDVLLAAYLLNSNSKQEEYQLLSLAQFYLQMSKQAFEESDPADIISRLVKIFCSRLESDDLINIYKDLELPLVNILFEMECAGVKIDPALLSELGSEILIELKRLQECIYTLSGEEFNINSPQQVGEIFEKLNYEVSKKTATGKISTNAEVLEELSEKYELPKLILEYREFEKLLNTYVSVLPKMVNPFTNRLHTTFNQTGTSTGRISSIKPNLQNIPIRTNLGKRTRQAFVADEGNVLISVDYSQVELRLLAHITEDSGMMESFRNFEDIHARTARYVFGAKTPEELKSARRLAKATNFGIAYGVGSYGLARNVGISRTEARQAINNYFATYPGIKKYMNETPERGREIGYVRTILGRLRRFPDLKSRNYILRSRAEREAINAPIQGAAADLIKLAMIKIDQYIKKEKLKTRMILQVHDEILLESPVEESTQISAKIKEIMENVYTLNVPLVAEVSIGSNWLEAK